MKIIIVGCGKVGQTLCAELALEGHEISIIDPNAHKVSMLVAECDVMGFVGSGLDVEIIDEAQVSECDLFMAMTQSDKTNLLCCLLAKHFGARQTIARVRSPESTRILPYLQKELNLSMIVNPERSAAKQIASILRFPTAITIDTFSNGLAELVSCRIPKKSILDRMPISRIHEKLDCEVLVAMVRRGDQVYIPGGDFILQTGDYISIVGAGHQTAQFIRKIGLNPHPIRSLMVIGGSMLCYYLVENLKDEDIAITIIDHDEAACMRLSESLQGVTIIFGDGSDEALLEEEGIEEVDAFASLTGIDEENVLLSLYARKENEECKTITKVSKIGFADVMQTLDLDTIINPKTITAEAVLKQVRAMDLSADSNVETIYMLEGEKAEAIEWKITKKSEITQAPLKELKFKTGVLIASIIRRGKIILPRGDDFIKVGDSVIVVTTLKGLHEISQTLQKGTSF